MATKTDTHSVAGFDKHLGRALCFITINRNMYWWTSITINTAINIQENTDACSIIKQYQIMTEEPLTIEVESMIPGPDNESAASFIQDFAPGVIIDNLECSLISDLLKPAVKYTAGEPVQVGNVPYDYTTYEGVGYESAGATTSKYGTFIIERNNIDISRGDFASLRLTIRAMGYGDDTLIQSDPGSDHKYAYDYYDDSVFSDDEKNILDDEIAGGSSSSAGGSSGGG